MVWQGSTLAGVGLRHARHARAALGGLAAVGLALAGQRVAELTRRRRGRSSTGPAGSCPATQRSPSPHLPGTHRSLQVPSSQYWPVAQVTPRHGSVLAAPADADLRRRAGERRDRCSRCSGPRDADLAAIGQMTPAHRSTHGPVFSSHFSPDGQVTPWQRCGTQKLVHALVAGRAGDLAARALQDALAVAAAEARRALRRAVSIMPSQLLSLPSQTSGVGSTQPSHTKPHRAAADEVPGLAGAAGRVDLRLGQARAEAGLAGLREVAVVDDAVAVVVDAVADLGLRHAGRVADELAVRADEGARTGRCRAPLPHVSPTPGSVPSSIWPLQLSSMPLQTSGCGVTVGASQNVPVPSALQARMPPRRQAPTPLLEHDAPTLKPSSMSPSQSLSRPSQISVGTAQPQGWPQALGGRPSSIWPLQLSSRQLQVSTAQCRAAPPFCATHVVGIGLAVRGDREAAAGGDAAAGRAHPAGVRHALVDLAVAVVVDAVADLGGRDGLGDDVDQRLLDRVGVGQRHEDRLPGAARGRHRVGGGLLGRASGRCRSGCRPARPSGSPPSGARGRPAAPG